MSVTTFPFSWPYDCLLNILYKLTTKKTLQLSTDGPLWGEYTLVAGGPYRGDIIWKGLHITASSRNILFSKHHYDDVIMGAMASHITSLNRLFSCRSKETSKLRVTGLCVGNSPGPVNSPHKWPVTLKIFPFDDVIVIYGKEHIISQGYISFGIAPWP